MGLVLKLHNQFGKILVPISALVATIVVGCYNLQLA